MGGVYDLGLVVQPSAGRLGVWLEICRTESGWTEDGVPLDARAEYVCVSVKDEVPYRDGMACKTGADLAPVLLDQDGQGMTRVPPVYSRMRRADSTTSGRHGGQCWSCPFLAALG